MPQDNGKEFAWKMFGWLMNLMAVTALGWALALGTRVSDIELWQASTSANRYTAQDHNIYATQMAQENARVWQEMANMKTEWLRQINEINLQLTGLPAKLEIPPKWWEQFVRDELRKNSEAIQKLQDAKKQTP